MAQIIEVKLPDIGGFQDVPIIEIAVKPGDAVQAEDTLLTLESDKATMDVPTPVAGVVKELRVKVGDKVAEGVLVALIESSAESAEVAAEPAPAPAPLAKPADPVTTAPASADTQAAVSAGNAAGAAALTAPEFRSMQGDPLAPRSAFTVAPATDAAEAVDERAAARNLPHASPSIRTFARQLGVDLARVSGSGPKGRILREDVQAYVKGVLATPAATAGGAGMGAGAGGLDLLPWPKVDFSKFGEIEIRPLSRIKKISGANLARNWAMIPHVTQFDRVDIGALEDFRVALNKENEKSGIKLTMLAFLVKASVAALRRFPEFNASLDGQGEEMRLVLKNYFHIGFAADTPNGLVVPVIRDADKKGVFDIAAEMAELAKKAREGKLSPADMQGGCFSISSLGGIGGTAFTPIINAPEVAILGVSKSEMQPQWDGSQFQPRLMLPLSLSYDHRVIDGAAAARFTSHLGQLLTDMRRVLL
ncbi:Dihydrolipoyllysine-residue acetyltransferase component of pyruvate dehydrogenase complex [Sterolibacterium denitrificans]|uniref:Dihydrolipoamide acetyltransferase component of pyruvate dehydrogenase complex n=1 Tax=Sterolibacterium denitrificans TaxID=157592 RepID=A0A7Z7HTR8_9PROT|nr:dihydrolipoyllysine-residue acetyltransferase [Sterolibacterium denitrificans]SMB32203.1 Dihydrolipoyllysine-residue acetyltransferase component of pyruvate dehydrogenase complex [Sterolibacterium denitrificans]